MFRIVQDSWKVLNTLGFSRIPEWSWKFRIVQDSWIVLKVQDCPGFLNLGFSWGFSTDTIWVFLTDNVSHIVFATNCHFFWDRERSHKTKTRPSHFTDFVPNREPQMKINKNFLNTWKDYRNVGSSLIRTKSTQDKEVEPLGKLPVGKIEKIILLIKIQKMSLMFLDLRFFRSLSVQWINFDTVNPLRAFSELKLKEKPHNQKHCQTTSISGIYNLT